MPFAIGRSFATRRWTGLALLAAACSGTPEGTVTVVTGDETDVFSRAPAPVLLVAERIAVDGRRTEITRAPLPTDTVVLGEQTRADVGAISVSALDASGRRLVHGESLFVQWGALETSPLEVFVQRTGELARMPRGPAALEPEVATIVVGRYVLEAAGTKAAIYDLLALRTLASPPVLPRPARSLATVATAALVIDEGGATTLDLSNGTTSPLPAPAGGTYTEVAGGARTAGADGTQYIVGGTRTTGGPTARVLVLDPEGRTSFAALSIPREGACATWVPGRGLVVIGGDASGAGAEVLAPGASIAAPLPFPPDAVRGCAAATLDPGHVAVAGGADGAKVRVLDLACTTGCAAITWPDALPFVRTEAFALAPDAILIAGDDSTGASRVFRASATGAKEIPLRVPRRGARLVPTAFAFTIIGGGPGIEQYLE